MSGEEGKKLTAGELRRMSLEEFKAIKKRPIVVVLDNIRSLHNVGSVFRTADAFAIEKIILTGITATPPHREIQKTALGATESVHWEYVNNCQTAVSELKCKGYTIIGVEQVHGSKVLGSEEVVLGDIKRALVFGNEVDGVSQDILDLCDEFWEIPQSGTKHSMNVSVAVGVILWELSRLSSNERK